MRRSGSAVSCGSIGGAPIGDAPPMISEEDLRGPRLLIAKFRSREGNRGVFFFISVTSFTESSLSQTILLAISPRNCTADRTLIAVGGNSHNSVGSVFNVIGETTRRIEAVTAEKTRDDTDASTFDWIKLKPNQTRDCLRLW